MAGDGHDDDDGRPSAQEFLSALKTKCGEEMEDKDVAATLVATLITGERDVEAVVKRLNALAKQRAQQKAASDE